MPTLDIRTVSGIIKDAAGNLVTGKVIYFRPKSVFGADGVTVPTSTVQIVTDAEGAFEVDLFTIDVEDAFVRYVLELPGADPIEIDVAAGADVTLDELIDQTALTESPLTAVLAALQVLINTHAAVKASAIQLGHIMIDGVTIEIDEDGVISVTGAAPTGGAGGVLSGTYPNPGFAVNMATQEELDNAVSTINTALTGKVPTSRTVNGHALSGDVTITKSNVGLGNVDNTADSAKPVSTAQQAALDAKADLVGGLVPSAQLPSFVDDVIEAANFAALPGTGATGKIYVTLDDNKTYRWSGSAYVEISASLALGETNATAYRGDRGKTAYDHSQATGNPHGTAISDISGLESELTGKANRDAHNNVLGNNIVPGFAVTTASGGTETLTVESPAVQVFIGSDPHIVKMPVVSTLPQVGFPFVIVNRSTSGNVVIRSSDSSNIGYVPPTGSAIVVCAALSGTGAASWIFMPLGNGVSGPLSVNAGNLVKFGFDGRTLEDSNVPYDNIALADGVLAKNANLSDLENTGQARNALGLGDGDEVTFGGIHITGGTFELNGSLVTFGDPDSGGTGFRALVVPNP